MRLGAAVFAVGCLAAACAPAASTVARAGDAPRRAEATPAVPPPLSNRAVIRLTTDPEREGRVLVELRLEGLLASAPSLRFQPSHDARIDTISARDSSGAIELRPAAEGSATKLGLARRATGPLDVRYAVTFGASADAYAPFAEPIELSVGGDDVLVLPETDERFPVELALKTGGVASGAASSFALGSDQHITAGASELRGAYFFAGDVGTATFHGGDGDDFAAWIGFTAFDPRWVSAETAAVRSAVDAYVGRMAGAGAPPTSILFSATRRDDNPIIVSSRTRGLVVSVDRRAAWTPAVRILVTQALTRRYLGGFLFVGERSDEASGTFFSEGFSRAVARELLFDASWLLPTDRAAELNTLLATLAFGEDARAVMTARGALVATALDVVLRKGSEGKRSLKTFLRERLAQAANDKTDMLPRADFVARVRESAGEPFAREMEAALRQGIDVKLPADLVGPCYRLVAKQLAPFELGFVASSAAEMTVTSVKPGSRAEAAGVRVGDVVSELHYGQGRSGVPVNLVVVRNAKKVPLRFMPAGTSKPGRQFERIPGIPDDRC